MFDRDTNYPTAVASYDDEGVDAAIDWCCEHLEDGDTLTVWTSVKSNLRNCAQLERLVHQHSDVAHVAGRGGGSVHTQGPVLMAWADMDDIGQVVRYGAQRIRALCVISWDDDALRPWVSAVRPTILGDGSAWEDLTPELDPVVVEALKILTRRINHNNTIAAGVEKDHVVSTLLALHDAGVPMDREAMEGWALAHGWSGKNPGLLAKFAEDINTGKRPRSRNVLGPDFVDHLRRRAQGGE